MRKRLRILEFLLLHFNVSNCKFLYFMNMKFLIYMPNYYSCLRIKYKSVTKCELKKIKNTPLNMIFVLSFYIFLGIAQLISKNMYYISHKCIIWWQFSDFFQKPHNGKVFGGSQNFIYPFFFRTQDEFLFLEAS